MIATITRYSLREARSNRLVSLLLLLLLAAFLLAEFAGAIAITEHRAVQASLAATVLRLGSAFLVALFVVTSLLREQQDRTLELILALPFPRGNYVLGKLVALLVIALAVAAACGGIALLYAAPVDVLQWSVSLACELWLIAAFGILLAFTFRQPVAALAGLGAIYVLCRGMGALLLIVHESVFTRASAFDNVADWIVGALAWILPSLYRFTDAGWLAWGSASWSDLGWVLVQTAIYLPLLTAAAAFDLYRREF